MKKKAVLKVLAYALAVSTFLTSVPVNATEATKTVTFTEEAEEEVVVETETELENETITEEESTAVSIDIALEALDLDAMTDEEIDKVVISYDGKTEELAEWLGYMPFEKFEKLIARNTVLSRNNTRYTYVYDENENISDVKEEVRPYYEIVLSDYGLNAPVKDGKANADKATFSKSTGQFYVAFQRAGVTARTDTVNISGINTSTALTSQQAALTVTVSTGAGNLPAGFSGTYGSTKATRKDSVTGSYTAIWLPFSYTYTLGTVVTGSNGVSGTDCYHDGSSLRVNIAKNAGVGTSSSSSTQKSTITFNATPYIYTASYNGNGNTGGSMASASFAADQAFSIATNAFTKQYTYGYNANGARNADLPSGGTAIYTFKGWNQAVPTYLTGNTTFVAQWNPASFTTGAASATGYDFLGWATTAAGSKAYDASQSVTPTSNMTLYALWKEHTYQIQYADSLNGKRIQETGEVYYDGGKKKENVVDKTKNPTDILYTVSDLGYGQTYALDSLDSLGIEHPGYTFLGWNWANSTYADSQTVSSLTEVDGDQITLTANWGANTDTAYEVKSYLQTDIDSEEYEYVDDKNYSYSSIATTDTEVTISPQNMEGYLTPEAVTQTILGDGSTVFEFFYLREGSRVNYTVNHYYQQQVDGEYVLYQSEICTGRAGESIDAIAKLELLDRDRHAANGIAIPSGYHLEMINKSMRLGRNSVMNVEYRLVEDRDISYTVEHYIRKTINGNWELSSREVYRKEVGDVVTPAYSRKAINTINGIVGYKVVLPQSQTLSLKANEGENIIKYFYDIERDYSKGTWINGVYIAYNTYQNIYGMSDEQAWELINALERGENAKIQIQNVEYTIAKNLDGTIAIRAVDTKEEKIVTVPSSFIFGGKVYQVTEIAAGAFRDNKCMEQVFISSGILIIGDYAFYHCTALKKCEMPDTIIKIGKYAFGKCEKLKDVSFSKSCYEMGEGCFFQDKELKKIVLKGKLTAIPKKCFYKCDRLLKVSFGNNVNAIGDSSFSECINLKKITLPASVKRIGKQSFYGCKKLGHVTTKSKNISKIGSKAFKKCKKGIKFSVPSSQKESYTKLLAGKF